MKKVLLLFLTGMFCLPLVMRGQVEVAIGTGLTDSDAPYQACYRYSWSESIYTAAEVGMAGTITKIAFNVSSYYASSVSSFKIYMGTRSTSTFSSTTDWTPVTNLTEVYAATNATLGTSMDWEVYTLTTPFVYNGTDNLVIVVSHDASDYNCDLTYVGSSATSQYLYRETDYDDSYAQHPGTYVGTTGTIRPDVKLTIGTSSLTCDFPTSVSISNITTGTAEMSWTPGGTESQWDIVLNTTGVAPDSTTTPDYTSTTNTYTFTNLTAATQYHAYVRANCGAGDVSMWCGVDFISAQYAASLPYICDFEDPYENEQWVLDNSAGTNKWYIDSADNRTDNGAYALYISSDNGATTNYNVYYTSNVWAYRDIDFDNYAEYELSFDIKGVGESCCDYVMAYIGDPTLPSGSTAPTGATQLTGNGTSGRFNLNSDWYHFSTTLNSSFNGVQRLYFLWVNDYSVGTSPAAVIDNIQVSGSNCGTPYNVTVDSTTSSTVAIQFTPALQTDSIWEVVIVAPGDTIDETQTMTIYTNTYEFTNLLANTTYTIYVRTNCGSEYSFWSSALSVQTDCPDHITVPYSENFDAYVASGTSVHPNCWIPVPANSADFPYISATYYSAPSSLYFYSGSSSNIVMALPMLDPTIPVNTTTISFMMKAAGNTAAYSLTVGVMDSLDANTFTPIANVYPSAVDTWEEKEIVFTNYTGSGQYIAFTLGGSYSFYMDDINLYYTPACVKPIDVTTDNVTSSMADVSWTARGSESTWQIAVVPHDTNVSNATVVYAYSQPYTVSNLQDNTQYDIYVKADCGGGDESEWSTACTFTTKCVATSTIPYTEDFQSYDMGSTSNFPSCWTRHQEGTTTQYPYIGSTGALYFYSTSTVMTYAASQMLNLSNETPGTLTLTFDVYKSNSAYGRLDIGYMTDADDINTFHLIKAIYPSDYASTSTWYTHTVVLPAEAYTSSVYIAFKAPAGTTNYVYLDNVTVDYNTYCAAPINLTVSNIAGTSALVSWSAVNGVNDYTLEYTELGQQNWQSQVVSGSSVMLSGLSPLISYEVRLYSNCTNGTSDTLTTTFLTPCIAGGDIPIGSGTSLTNYMPSFSNYKYSYVQEIYLASELGGAQTLNSLSLQCSSCPNPNRSYQIYLMHTTSTGPAFAWLSIDSAKLVFTGTVSWQTGWNLISFDSLFHYDGTSNLAVIFIDNTGTYGTINSFYIHSYSGGSRYAYGDGGVSAVMSSTGTRASFRNNIIFGGSCDSTNICAAPNLFVSSYDSSSVVIGWAAGYNETTWELEYKLSSSSTWSSEGTVTGTSYTLTGLSSGASYDIRMRSDCGAGEYSDWASTSVTLPCYVTELPFVEDFDTPLFSGTSSNDTYVSCWSRMTNYSSAYPYCSSSVYHSGAYSLYFYGTSAYYSYAVLPRFDNSIVIDSLQIEFWAYRTSAGYQIEVGIMSDPTDPNTFETLGYFSPSATSTWERTEIKSDAYAGTGHYVAFRIPAWFSNYMYIDDVNIYYIPECKSVENIQAINITSTSADITWTAGGSESQWELLYGTNVNLNVDQPSMIFYDIETLTGLMPNTLYTVYIRAACDNGDYSPWMSYSFRTECASISALPYSEDFESYSSGSSYTNVSPTCWNRINTGTASVGCPTVYSNSNYTHSGTKALYFYSTTGNSYADQYSILPELDTTAIQLNTLRLSLYAKRYNSSTSYQNYVVVGVMTDRTDVNTFTSVDTITFLNTDMERYYVDFANYTGYGSYIAIKAPKPTSPVLYNYTYLDDISLDVAPSCDAPTNLAVTLTNGTEATLTWTDSSAQNSWQVLLVPATTTNVDFTQAQTVYTNSYTDYSLLGNRSYTFYVRTACSNGLGYSDWVSMEFFIPSVNPAQLPYYNGFEDTTENAEWTIRNNISGNLWYIGALSGTTDSVLYVSGDNGLTSNYTGTTGQVWAYRDINMPIAAEFDVSFKWACQGESSYDYMYAFLGDPVEVSASTSNAVTTPAGTTQLMNGSNGRFNLSATAQWHTTTFDASMGGGVKRLYFVWRNDASGQHAPAIRIDSVVITSTNCGRPYNLIVSNVAPYTANITFHAALSTDSEWQYVVTTGTNPDTEIPVTITDTTATLAGLTPETTYHVYVRTSCGSGEYSSWSTVATFTTPIACPAPTGLAVNTITTTTAVVSWVENGTASEWTLEYGVPGFVPGTGTSVTVNNTPSYTLTGLTSGTQYDLYVTANCSATELSTSVMTTFVTTCETINTFPYTEDFEHAGNMPACWSQEYVTGSASWSFMAGNHSSGSLTDAHSGSYNAFLFYGSTTSNYTTKLISPVFDLTNVTNPYLSYWYTQAAWSNDQDRLTVYYRTSATDTWHQLAQYLNSVTSWTMDSLELPSPSSTYQLAFEGITAYGYGITLDDITIASGAGTTPTDTCPAPTGLTATTVENETVTLTWSQEANTADSWQVEYREQGATTWNTMVATTVPYTLTGLTGLTTYEIQVLANCTNGLISDPSNMITVTTTNTGISDYDLESRVRVYPNPTVGKVTITAESQMECVNVYDVYGKLIQTLKVEDTSAEVDMSSYAAGVYFVRIQTDNGLVTKRVVKR